MRFHGKRLVFTVAVALLAAAITVWLLWSAGETFDQKKWIEASHNSDIHRNEMADDLLRRYQLIGMSREEIESLLGRPPATAYFREFCDYVYWLGPERGFISIDSEWLCVSFNNDVVVRAEIVRD